MLPADLEELRRRAEARGARVSRDGFALRVAARSASLVLTLNSHEALFVTDTKGTSASLRIAAAILNNAASEVEYAVTSSKSCTSAAEAGAVKVSTNFT